MTFNLSGYRIGTGTLTVAVLDDSYAIELLTNQSDRKQARWTRPDSRSDIVQPAAIEQGLDGSLADYGGDVVVWTFPWLSPLMMDYLYENYFDSNRSALMTIRTYDRIRAEWRVLNCTAQWPAPDVIGGLVNIGRGLQDFPVRFILCQDAAES